MATKDTASSGSSEKGEKVEDIQHYATKTETKQDNLEQLDTYATANLNAVFENPLAGLSREALMEDVEEFCRKFDLMDHIEVFRKGALVSQNPHQVRNMPELSPDDIQILELEKSKKWHQPWRLYWLVSTYNPQFIFPQESLRTNMQSSNVFSRCRCAGHGRNREQWCCRDLHKSMFY